MIPAVASGDVKDRCIGLCLTVVTAVDVNAGSIEVGKGGSQPQTLGRGGGNETIERCDAVGIEGISGSPQGIIIKLCRGNAGGNESSGRLMREELGDEVESLVDNPQTIKHHGFDGFPNRAVSHCWILLRCFVSDVANAQFVKHTRNEAEMI
jgi:hypothetical protein